jgi:hypothetical protein
MAETGDDDTTFRLLRDEYPLFLKAAGQSETLATKFVEKFLTGGERDSFDGRTRYKIWMQEMLPGGLEPSPYDGDFWRSYSERGIACIIEPWNSSAHRTGPTSAKWKEFDGRQTAECRIFGIRVNHEIVVEFLQSAGMLSEQPSASEQISSSSVTAQADHEEGGASASVKPGSAAAWIDELFPNEEWILMTGKAVHGAIAKEAEKRELKKIPSLSAVRAELRKRRQAAQQKQQKQQKRQK